MTELLESGRAAQRPSTLSLSTTAARTLATTTKTAPQMCEITPRWLSRMLPWMEVPGGTYRVNRRLSYTVGDGRVECVNEGSRVTVIPGELCEIPGLRGFDDPGLLSRLAERFEQREYGAGEVVAEFGHQIEHLLVVAHGKIARRGVGEFGDEVELGRIAGGDYLGEQALLDNSIWAFTSMSITPCTVLALPIEAFEELRAAHPALDEHIQRARSTGALPRNSYGEASIAMAAGHDGEAALPGTFVDYETSPREYELSIAQTVLRVHTRVADLYSHPMDQTEQQLRLTIEALRERQEHELINNPDFGLLHNVDLRQRIHTRSGPPTPADLDDLLARRRKTRFFLAHPRTIAAFGRECTNVGAYPATTTVDGRTVPAWRGVPMLPCDKIPISERATSSILAMRTGVDDNGVIGLRQTGLPDEYEPGLNVRFMGISEKAITSYLVSAYFAAAVLVPDALGVLENVELGHERTRESR